MARKTKLSEADVEVLSNGIRWTRNILVELQRNYAEGMTEEAASLLRTATRALGNLDNRDLTTLESDYCGEHSK